ncbi:MAG: hypothetical protein IJC52_03265, partial [Clostridia bacterium]|nr:hypothetical protein [Clostridia bacterium]
MQKDWVVGTINSVMLNTAGENAAMHIPVESVLVNGVELGVDGYLDIGLIDTMKDLIVNFIGAVVFSIVGIFYLKGRDHSGLAAALIPVVVEIGEDGSPETE